MPVRPKRPTGDDHRASVPQGYDQTRRAGRRRLPATQKHAAPFIVGPTLKSGEEEIFTAPRLMHSLQPTPLASSVKAGYAAKMTLANAHRLTQGYLSRSEIGRVERRRSNAAQACDAFETYR